MKKKAAVFALILVLVIVLALTLTACNSDNFVATFELDENDGIENFTLRRGVVFQYKVSELNKIDGITASWKVNDNGTVKIEVSNAKAHLDEVNDIINSEPSLQFKTENSANAQAQFLGKDNIQSIKLSYDKSSIQIEFTANGLDKVNDYLNRQLYLFLGDEYLTTMTSKIMLTNSNATVTISVPNNSNPMYAETLTAQLNAATFGLKVKNVSVK